MGGRLRSWAFLVLLSAPAVLRASEDWPQFRGPTGDGVSSDRGLPVEWSESRNIAWKTPIPGLGRSSPVILGDRIWLTTAVMTGVRHFGGGADDFRQAERAAIGVVCLDRATGKVLYHVEVFLLEKPEPVHWLNTYATPTPVAEAGRLFCDFGTFGTACLDAAAGGAIWKRRLPLDHQVGPGSSPILYKDFLILVRDGRDQQYVTALNKATGETVWKTDRPPIRAEKGDFRKSFSTPLILESGGRAQMVAVGSQWIVSYDPETGREIWRADDGRGFSAAPRPVFANGLVYVSTGNTGGRPELWALRVDGQGDVTGTHVAWKRTAGIPMVPSPLLLNEELYVVNDDGIVVSLDARTGAEHGRHRAGAGVYASPVAAEGRILIFAIDGTAVVLEAGKEMKRLAENHLDGAIYASPAIAGGAIYVRTDTHLYSLREPGRAPEGTLRAGAARIDITPEKPVGLAGYASRTEPSQGVHDPLSARALAFEEGGRRLVLVSVDNLGFYGATAEPLRKAVLDACRLEPSELFLAAIHTHSAPSLTLDEAKGRPNNVEYTRLLGDRVAAAARQALDRLAPVRIAVGTGACPVGANRRETVRDESGEARIVLGRNPSAMTDRDVQVLKVSRIGEDRPAAILFAYATHSTSLGPGNLRVSGDIHGLAEQFVETFLGGETVSPGFAGASGDIDPWFRVLPEFKTAGGWIPEPVLLSAFLGEEVVRVADGLKETAAAGPIRTRLQVLELPGKAEGGGPAEPRPSRQLAVAVGRVGGVAFVGLGGEVFHEIGRAIKAGSPFPVTFVITHCNGAAGYLPTARAHEDGGYEVQSSGFAPAAADMVIAEVLRLLKEL